MNNANEKEKKDENKEEKIAECVVRRAKHQSAIHDLLSKNFTNLDNAKGVMGGRKAEGDSKEEDKKQKQIDYQVSHILINNNEIRNIRGLSETLTFVLPRSDPQNLLWLNLSYNFL